MNNKFFLKLINAIGLFAVLSDFSNADIETYPLTNTTSTAPAVKNPAETEKTVMSQQSQEEAELLAQFGKKKLGTCNMTYKLEGFSLAYRQYDGFGEVTCVNGQKASVKLSQKALALRLVIPQLKVKAISLR
jgi:hypothetical protein